MYYSRCIRIATLLIVLVAVVGCNSKQDKQAASTGVAPAAPGEIKAVSGQTASGAVTASPQDQAAIRSAAAHILSQMEAGDFAVIYKDASPGFKKIGPEPAFVGKFQQTRQKTGLFKKSQETSLVSSPNGVHVIVYRLENERFSTDRRLTFSRSQNGTMILEGLNQHDEPKK